MRERYIHGDPYTLLLASVCQILLALECAVGL